MGWTQNDSIVNGINLNVKQGELIVINGPVGAGKTSFLSFGFYTFLELDKNFPKFLEIFSEIFWKNPNVF